MDEFELFEAAVGMVDPSARAALLDRECAGRPDLRARLNALLQAHGRSHAVLDGAPVDASETVAAAVAAEVPVRTVAGAVIAGRYKLLEEIGDGGMGTVWMAEQRSPVKRLVAVKLIKAGMDSKAVLARFEAERQALAVMDHPNIAKVLDAGTDERGRPYFVMELVKGLSLTEYCDARRLSVKERLELFVQICAAVQHAHQKAVIHRDLKPSNVLVTEHDGRPVPKVIDFGLAKALGATNTLTERTLHTAYGTVVGTPLYMAPEQVGINALDVDTRTDIYALGVILYELLTGSTPLEKARFREAAWEEVKRLIREEEPPRPSTRLSSAAALPSLAASRQIEPAQLRRLVAGELDWIVMKALEKDRSRRYETANGLARDINRYLSDETVEACPPTARYRLWKFARRYRAAIATTGTIAFLLVGGIAVSSWQAVRATRAEARSRESAESERLANLEAQKSAAAERQANEQSKKRLAQLQKGNEIITSIFDELDIRKVRASADSLERVLAQRLVRAAKQLEGDAVGDPLAVAKLQGRLARSLLNLGDWQAAADLYVKARDTYAAARGPDDTDALECAVGLANCYNYARKWEQALPIWEDAVKRSRAGSDDYLTMLCTSGLGSCYHYAGKPDLALPLFEESLALMKTAKGVKFIDTLASLINLGACYDKLRKLDKAIATFEEALKQAKAQIGPEHPETVKCMGHLARCYMQVGKLDLALPMMEEAFRLEKLKLGPQHPYTMVSMKLLGDCYARAGEGERAIPLLQESLKYSAAKYGPESIEALEVAICLGSAYTTANKLDVAVPLLERTLKTLMATVGDDHDYTLTCSTTLANAYTKSGKPDLALPLYEVYIQRGGAQYGADNHEVIRVMDAKARVYVSTRQFELAAPLFEKVLAVRRATLGPANPYTLSAIDGLGLTYKALGKFDLALPLLEEGLKLRRASGIEDVETINNMLALGEACYDARKPALALPVLEEALQSARAKLAPDGFRTLKAISTLALAYRAVGKFDRAIALNDEFIRLARAKYGGEHPDTLRCMRNQAYTYGDAGKPELAVPLLQDVLKTQRAKLQPGNPDTLVTIQSLAICYKADGKPDLAIPLYQEVLDAQRARLGADHADTLRSMSAIGTCNWELRRLDKSVPLFEELLAIQVKKLGRDHVDTIATIANLGVNLRDSGRVAEAIPLLEEAYRGSKKYPVLGWVGSQLMLTLADAGKADVASKLIDQETLEARRQLPPGSIQLAGKLSEIGLFLLQVRRFGEAETLLRESLATRERDTPDVWSTYNTKSMLGGALLSQKKYVDAEPLLIKGFEGMKQRESTIPRAGGAERRIPQALDRLIQLATATDHPDDVKKWQAERAKYPAVAKQASTPDGK